MREPDSLSAPLRDRQPRPSPSLGTPAAAAPPSTPVAGSVIDALSLDGAVSSSSGNSASASASASLISSVSSVTSAVTSASFPATSVPSTPPIPAPFVTSSGTTNVANVASQGEASQTRLHYLEALVEASNAISAHLEPSRVAETLVARVAEIMDVPGVAVLLLDEQNNLRPASAKGLSSALLAAQVGPMANSIAGRALTEKRTFATWDVRESGDARLAKAAQEAGIVAAAAAPMFFGGKPVGSLNVYCRDIRCFSDDQFQVLSLLAAQGAIALTNAQTYRDARDRAAEQRASFSRVGAALSSSLDIGETLHLIVQLVVEMTGADGGAMFMLQSEDEGGGMRLAGMRGLDRRSVRRFRRTSVSPLAGRALAQRKVIVVPDARAQTDTAFPTLRAPSVDGTEDSGPLAEVHSAICVPVLVGGRPVGVLEQYAKTPGRFGKTDIQLLETFAHQASIAMENARLYAQERGVTQTLQRAFLPDLPSDISGFQIGRIYAPGSEIAQVGGDTYDLLPLPDGRIAVFVADVSGSGTYAATVAVMAKYTIRAYALENPHPSSVLARVNEALIPQTEDSRFLTVCYTLLDPKTRTVSIASAAHPPALLCRKGEKVARPVGGVPGLIAGFLPNQTYPAAQFTMESGDVLVFCTDGVLEARRDKTQFGQEKLEKLVGLCAHLPAQSIASLIYDAVTEYALGDRMDDIALLVLKAD